MRRPKGAGAKRSSTCSRSARGGRAAETQCTFRGGAGTRPAPRRHALRQRALAEAGKKRCTVVAPVDGTVLEITTHESESAVGKPLLKLGDTRTLYVMAEVYTDDREGVEVNQKAEVGGRGLPAQLRGTACGDRRANQPRGRRP